MVQSFYVPPANCQVPDLGAKWQAIFGRRNDGFFVEVGAYDGENYSNTSCLADAGWAGLYIEPISEFAARCRARHASNPRVEILECAASDTTGSARIFVGDTLTTLVGDQVEDYEKIDWAKGLHRGESREIDTERLDHVLEARGVLSGFDVLVVDVEGAEDKVMGGFDVARWQPKAILIELEDEHPDFVNNSRVVNSVASVRKIITSNGYRLFFKDHINSLYLRSDVSDRVEENKRIKRLSPRVTVGLPTYNRPSLLKEALESFRNQKFTEFEVIISDNCSPNPLVSALCIACAENDSRFIYIRQPENRGAAVNFVFVFKQAKTPLFMWASDDDIWDADFLMSAVKFLDHAPNHSAWMSHLEVIDSNDSKHVIRKISNLSRFTSGFSKNIDLQKFVFEPEVLGKANLIYCLYITEELKTAFEVAFPFLNDWGGDMILIYAVLCRYQIHVDPRILFKKRAAESEIGFMPTEPRKHIVPWTEAGRFYGALIAVSAGTPHHAFTKAIVRARYLYDVLYTRLKLRQPAPWRPSQGAGPGPAARLPHAAASRAPSQPENSPQSHEAVKQRFIQEFRDAHYVRHNQRRQEHLASLGLPLAGRSVLELGAGIGDHTTFFNDRGCSICITDGRPELYEILKERYHWMRTELLDLEKPDPNFQDVYEIVYAYGLLYHLNDPAGALRAMARWCGSLLLLETGVSPDDDVGENLVFEHKEMASQAVSGTGCRPSRAWIFDQLQSLFPYVYVTRTQPWHPEFPLDWNSVPPDAKMTRSVFVASRTPLDLPTLSTELLRVQVHH